MQAVERIPTEPETPLRRSRRRVLLAAIAALLYLLLATLAALADDQPQGLDEAFSAFNREFALGTSARANDLEGAGIFATPPIIARHSPNIARAVSVPRSTAIGGKRRFWLAICRALL